MYLKPQNFYYIDPIKRLPYLNVYSQAGYLIGLGFFEKIISYYEIIELHNGRQLFPLH